MMCICETSEEVAGMKKRWKYVGATAVLTCVFVIGLGVLVSQDVFGKYVSGKPYIVEGSNTGTKTVTTSEGSNQKGKMGSGAEPCVTEIPTCEGKKGTETNPFIVLEIVPDKAQQQLSYLTGDPEQGMPYDPLELGIRFGKNYLQETDMTNLGYSNTFGYWFRMDYSVYEIGKETKEKMPYAHIGKYYTVKLTTADVEAAGYKVSDFEKEYNNGNGKMADLAGKFPALFERDTTEEKVKIRDIAIQDNKNWRKTRESDDKKYKVTDSDHITEEDFQNLSVAGLAEKYPDVFREVDSDALQEESCWNRRKDTEYKNFEEKSIKPESGFFYYAGKGNGDYSMGNAWDENSRRFSKNINQDDENVWKYIEKEEDLPEGARDLWAEYSTHAWDLWGNPNANSNLQGGYLKIGDIKYDKIVTQNGGWGPYTQYTFQYEKIYYKFEYYGLKTNDILKRSLFRFADQKDYENFHMQVICMTPEEINQIAEKDTDDKLDWIERADMYYISSYTSAKEKVDGIDKFYNFYHRWIRGQEDYSFDQNKELPTFYENDLEWDSCMKIIKRASDTRSLPLMFNAMIGNMLAEGVNQDSNIDETHMYVTAGIEGVSDSRQTDRHMQGSLNNLSKLYLITAQFDLAARRSSGAEYKRTFMDDIYPYLQVADIPEESVEGAEKNTAKTTGYYMRGKLCTCDDSVYPLTDKQKCYYLWNSLTFYPIDLDMNINNGGVPSAEDQERYVTYGYLKSYFNTNANPFIQADISGHQSGTTSGTDDQNVSIVGIQNTNNNQSSILDPSGGYTQNTDTYTDVLHNILNIQPEIVQNLTVTVLKQKKEYVRLSDTSVLVDYRPKGKYAADKKSYVKVKIDTNGNNEPGVVTSITFKNTSEPSPDKELKLYATKSDALAGENEWEIKSFSDYTGQTAKGYPIDGVQTAYIPYSLEDWQKGYHTIEVKTVGRIYNSTKKRYVHGEEIPEEITIGERTLFDLE